MRPNVVPPISLTALKTNDPAKSGKPIGQKNISELRKALAAVLKDTDAKKSSGPVEKSAEQQRKSSNPEQVQSAGPKPKEVPEAVLRNLLKVEKDPSR